MHLQRKKTKLNIWWKASEEEEHTTQGMGTHTKGFGCQEFDCLAAKIVGPFGWSSFSVDKKLWDPKRVNFQCIYLHFVTHFCPKWLLRGQNLLSWSGNAQDKRISRSGCRGKAWWVYWRKLTTRLPPTMLNFSFTMVASTPFEFGASVYIFFLFENLSRRGGTNYVDCLGWTWLANHEDCCFKSWVWSWDAQAI